MDNILINEGYTSSRSQIRLSRWNVLFILFNRWLLNNYGLLNRNILYCWSNILNSFLRTVFALLLHCFLHCPLYYSLYYSLHCLWYCFWYCLFELFFSHIIDLLLHFTKSEIYYVLTKMSSGKFLINIHFADIYHFLLISIITQNAQSNYYYLKCFHHLTLTWMIQAGLFLFIISASFILQIHYIEKGIFHSVNLNKNIICFYFTHSIIIISHLSYPSCELFRHSV